MKDGLIRRALKAVALGVFIVNIKTTRAIRRRRGEKPFRLGGACRACAKCCEEPGIQVDKITWYVPLFRRLFLLWHQRVNGFELVGEDPKHKVFLFRCTHFDWETRQCDSYSSRPGMCRDYPRNQLWQGRPDFLPGCGYRAIHPNAKAFTEALEKEGLSGEKLEEVKKKLFLDE